MRPSTPIQAKLKVNTSSEKSEESEIARPYSTLSELLSVSRVTSSTQVSRTGCDQPRRNAWDPANRQSAGYPRRTPA